MRRIGEAEVNQVVSKQALYLTSAGQSFGPFCNGDLGAAILSKRGTDWELDAIGLAELQTTSGCPDAKGRAWLLHGSRCWVEAALVRWALPPLSQSYADECGSLDFFPPELAETNIGAGMADETEEEGDAVGGLTADCDAVDCSEFGNCLDGRLQARILVVEIVSSPSPL